MTAEWGTGGAGVLKRITYIVDIRKAIMIISRKEWDEATREVIDEETGMTRADYLEYIHGDELEIIEED